MPTPSPRRLAAAPFLGLGGAFLAIGTATQPALLVLGLVFLVMALVRARASGR